MPQTTAGKIREEKNRVKGRGAHADGASKHLTATAPFPPTRTPARGTTAAEARSRAGAVAPPNTQRSGTPGAAKQGA